MDNSNKTLRRPVCNKSSAPVFHSSRVAFLAGDDACLNSSLESALNQVGLSVFKCRSLDEAEIKDPEQFPALLIIDGARLDSRTLQAVRILKAYQANLNVALLAGGQALPDGEAGELFAACFSRALRPDRLSLAIKALLPERAAGGAKPNCDLTGHCGKMSAGEAWKNIPQPFKLCYGRLLAKVNALSQNKKYLENILDSSLDAIMILNDQGLFTYINRGAEIMLGYRLDLYPGLALHELISKDAAHPKNTVAKLKTAANRAGQLETWLVKADGSKLYGLLSFDQLSLPSREGKREYLLVIKDIDDRRRLEEKLVKQNLQLEKLCVTDALTQLYNRRYLDRKLYNEFQRVKRFRGSLAVIFIDFDNFKTINDRFGHEIGDKILCQAAREISYALREVDIFARWGGEEFLVVLPQTDLVNARIAAERLREAIDNPAQWAGIHADLQVTISLGVAVYPYEGVTSPAELIEIADRALYRAKRNGKNRVVAMDELISDSFGDFTDAARPALLFSQPPGWEGIDENLRRKFKNVLSYLYNALHLEAGSFGAFMVWGGQGRRRRPRGEEGGRFMRILAANFQHNHGSLKAYPLLITLEDGRPPELCGALVLSRQLDNEIFLLNYLDCLMEALAGYYKNYGLPGGPGAPLIITANSMLEEAGAKDPLSRLKRNLKAWLTAAGFKKFVMIELDPLVSNCELVCRVLNFVEPYCFNESTLKNRLLTDYDYNRAIKPNGQAVWDLFAAPWQVQMIKAGFSPEDGPLIIRPLWLEGAKKFLLLMTDSLDDSKESYDRLNFYVYQAGCYHNYELTSNWVDRYGRVRAVNRISADIAGQPTPQDRESFVQVLLKSLAQLMPGIKIAVYLLEAGSRSARLLSCRPAFGPPVQIEAKDDQVVAHLLAERAGNRSMPPHPFSRSVLNLPLGRPGEAIGFIRICFENNRKITAYELDPALLIQELVNSFTSVFNYSRPAPNYMSAAAFQIISAMLKHWLV